MNIETANNYTQVKCAWCSGTGKWNVATGNYAVCVVCGGKGQVSVSGRGNQCGQCRGSGKSNSVNPCLTCAGTGWEKVIGHTK